MWEKALTQAISRSSTWDLVIGLIAILMYKMAMKHRKGEDTFKLNVLRCMLGLGLSTLLARVIITIANLAFN